MFSLKHALSIIALIILSGPVQVNAQSKIYLFDQFQKGTLVNSGGMVIDEWMVNYNTLTEKIYLLKGTYKIMLDKNLAIDSATMGNRTLVLFDSVYYELLYDGNSDLFKHHRTKLRKEAAQTGYGSTSHSSAVSSVSFVKSGDENVPEGFELVDDSRYWLRVDGELKSFETRKDFLMLFPENRGPIKSYLKEHRPSFLNNTDMIELIMFYDTL